MMQPFFSWLMGSISASMLSLYSMNADPKLTKMTPEIASLTVDYSATGEFPAGQILSVEVVTFDENLILQPSGMAMRGAVVNWSGNEYLLERRSGSFEVGQLAAVNVYRIVRRLYSDDDIRPLVNAEVLPLGPGLLEVHRN